MRANTAMVLATALLTGCGGASSTVPKNAAARAKEMPVAISIAIPRAGGGANARIRRPAYVSTATQSAVVNVTPDDGPTTRTVVKCGASTCVGTVPARIGVDTFAIALNDEPDGTGATLSTGQARATVVEGQNNTVDVTFDGVVASVIVTLASNNPPVNAPATINVNLRVDDPDGRQIIGPGSYTRPIALTDSDTTGATTLSTQTVTGPNDPVPTVTYNGAWIGGDTASARITASVPANPHVKPMSDELVPTPQLLEYAIPSANAQVIDIATGPDGAFWFTESGTKKIGRMTTDGTFTEFPIPGQYALPEAIASSRDGNLYVADMAFGHETLDQITTAGVFTRNSIAVTPARQRNFYSIVVGPDGNIWAPDYSGNAIARFTPAGVETDFAVPTTNAAPNAITVGPDGALWFTESLQPQLGKITPAGAITEYPIVALSGVHVWSYAITSGTDGELWFNDNSNEAVGRMTTAGAGIEYPNSYFHAATGYAISPGPDGAIYFSNAYTLGRVSANGVFQGFNLATLMNNGGSFTKFTVGPDGNIWYADRNRNVIGKIVF